MWSHKILSPPPLVTQRHTLSPYVSSHYTLRCDVICGWLLNMHFRCLWSRQHWIKILNNKNYLLTITFKCYTYVHVIFTRLGIMYAVSSILCDCISMYCIFVFFLHWNMHMLSNKCNFKNAATQKRLVIYIL